MTIQTARPVEANGHGAEPATGNEKLLMAALHLEQSGVSPFSAEALVVEAWRKFPRTFGLNGYADQYPDSNKVLTRIMGGLGLVNRGWLARTGEKLYELTGQGRHAAQRLSRAPAVAPARLTAELERFLLGLLDGPAVERFRAGLKQELAFADACRFWGVRESSQAGARMEVFAGQLAQVRSALAAGGADLAGGRHVSAEDVELVRRVDEYLRERFARHLHLLCSRKEREGP